MRQIIEEAAREKHSPGSDLQKMADLYRSFMDVERIESLGLSRLEAELEKIDAIRSQADLARYIGHAQGVGVAHLVRGRTRLGNLRAYGTGAASVGYPVGSRSRV